jgi:hypothetical protein
MYLPGVFLTKLWVLALARGPPGGCQLGSGYCTQETRHDVFFYDV